MKDYYYILGVSNQSDEESIKHAYRKLSRKFHPDVNAGDDFFTHRFQEIREAYETLSNPEARIAYDVARRNDISHKSQHFLPVIDKFHVSQSAFEYNQPVEIEWKCYNADSVLLEPFGTVEIRGKKIYKVKQFDEPELKLKLTAYNSSIDKRISASITLENITYNNLKAKIIKQYLKDVKSKQLALDTANKIREKQLPIYKKTVPLADGLTLQIVQKDKFTSGLDKVRIENQIPADGFYFSKNRNSGYEIRNGVIEKNCYIQEYKQKDGKTLRIAGDRVMGVGKKSRAWVDEKPAPTGKYRLGWIQKVNIKDGFVT